jgi:hypothetical protein
MENQRYTTETRLKDKDYSTETDALIAETDALVKNDIEKIPAALEKLLVLEKQTRQVIG